MVYVLNNLSSVKMHISCVTWNTYVMKTILYYKASSMINYCEKCNGCFSFVYFSNYVKARSSIILLCSAFRTVRFSYGLTTWPENYFCSILFWCNFILTVMPVSFFT